MRDVYKGYVTGEKPNPDTHVIASFRFHARDAANAAQAIAAESSVGTWTELSTMKPRIRKRLAAKVFRLDAKNGAAEIAYPLALFEPGNAPQLLSDVAGNVFGMRELDSLRLEDLQVPKAYAKSFKGPAVGLEGVRKMLGTGKSRRPHFGTIVKPKVGLTPKENAEVGFESFVGGMDFLKDDENLSSQSFSPFEERVVRMLESVDRAESETGERKMYAPNVTAETGEMVRRAEFVKSQGGTCIMVDIVTAGFSGLQSVRNAGLKLPIHAHRAMYAAFARNPDHGISMMVLARLARMVGVDQLHTGAIVGKMEGSKHEVLGLNAWLRDKWHSFRPVFPVASGGIDPLRVPSLLAIAGTELVINAGGGIHGHPDGTRAGAMAFRQAYDAWRMGIPLEEYAKGHKELAAAFRKWGGRRIGVTE
ncbi:MAG: type III ribulose-bisphosphate carboxylase [Candidatus ainarchaeum sp.]|nr:type III ribulose-bisphosphate carboxylase [Candidatus ainarchaeum sp.]